MGASAKALKGNTQTKSAAPILETCALGLNESKPNKACKIERSFEGGRMFNPMRAFKHMHHDVCVDGKNIFAPCPCECFCYSKQFLPIMLFPVPVKVDFNEPDINNLSMKTTELRRVLGPPDEDGYYTYIKELK